MRLVILAVLFLAACHDNQLEQIINVNNQVNTHPYKVGVYDCRMYVRDKHDALLREGISENDMTVLYRLTHDLQSHVVLRIISGGDYYILDNREPMLRKLGI